MQDNVIPCPHCHGRGEMRVSWYVVTVYQDCSEWSDPYSSREAAEQHLRAQERKYGNPTRFGGGMMKVVMREVKEATGA